MAEPKFRTGQVVRIKHFGSLPGVEFEIGPCLDHWNESDDGTGIGWHEEGGPFFYMGIARNDTDYYKSGEEFSNGCWEDQLELVSETYMCCSEAEPHATFTALSPEREHWVAGVRPDSTIKIDVLA